MAGGIEKPRSLRGGAGKRRTDGREAGTHDFAVPATG